MFKREERENIKLRLLAINLPDNWVVRLCGRAWCASMVVRFRSLLRGALTLCIEKDGQFVSVDTDIAEGVPPIVRAHTQRFANILGTRLDHDAAVFEMFGPDHPYYNSGRYFL